jgi:stage V sporulation protein SpoVS
MPDLDFEIISADVKPYAAAPTIDFKLRISNAVEGEEVYAAALKTQVRIEAVYRKYDDETKKRLLEVFGKPERWGETLKSLFWKSITIPVPRFTGQTVRGLCRTL